MLKELEKRIKKKQIERDRVQEQILDLTKDLTTIDAVISELESLARMVPKANGNDSAPALPVRDIRFGTEVYHAREELQKAGKALWVGEILKRQGKDDAKGPRSSLASQLGTYAREGRIFTKEGPNIFGLIDYGPVPISAADEAIQKDIIEESIEIPAWAKPSADDPDI